METQTCYVPNKDEERCFAPQAFFCLQNYIAVPATHRGEVCHLCVRVRHLKCLSQTPVPIRWCKASFKQLGSLALLTNAVQLLDYPHYQQRTNLYRTTIPDDDSDKDGEEE